MCRRPTDPGWIITSLTVRDLAPFSLDTSERALILSTAFGIGKGPDQEAENFWKELIVGIAGHNLRRRIPHGLTPIPAGFFQYHFEIEAGHGANVWKELEETFHKPGFNKEKFLEVVV